jgi:hypothetical protein
MTLTAWLAMHVFLCFDGVSARTVPPPVSVASPFVEDVAQDKVDVPVIAKRLSAWFPVWTLRGGGGVVAASNSAPTPGPGWSHENDRLPC